MAPLMTVTQVAAVIGMSRHFVYRLVADGKLAAERHGRGIRIPEQALAAYRATASAVPPNVNAPAGVVSTAGA